MDIVTPLLRELHACELLPALPGSLGQGQSLWLVGGALRDALRGLPPADFDFATDFDPAPLARAFAAARGWTWVPLDAVRGQCRLVRKAGVRPLTVDFAQLRAPTLAQDLLLRDYTLNALALSLVHATGTVPTLIDPLQGAADLQRRVLRHCSPPVLRDDPLRVLKGARHAVELGLTPDPETLAAMCAAAPLMSGVAVERVRAEWLRILAAPRVAHGVRMLDELGLLPLLCGGPTCRFDKEMCERLSGWVESEAALGTSGLVADLQDLLEEGMAVATLGRFVALTHWLTSGGAVNAGQQLKFSTRARRAIASSERILTRPPERPADTPRARALWLSGFGPEPALSVLLLAGSGCLPATEAISCLAAWKGLQQGGRIPDLVPPEWIIMELGVEPGPILGRLLDQLRAAEIRGNLRTRGEGERFLRHRAKRD